MTRVDGALGDALRRSPPLILLGVGALLFGVLLELLSGAPLMPGYLAVWLAVAALPLGALPLLMALELTGGRFADEAAVPLRALARTLPAAAVLFLPVLVFQARLYPWAADGFAPRQADLAAYLSPGLFTLRAVLYFAVWLLLARAFGQAPDGPPRRRLAVLGLVLHLPLGTLAAVDWAMSVEPDWRSAAYGLMLINAQMATALAYACRTPAAREAAPATRRALGALLLALAIAWAYFAFNQYLIIWSANLPEEVVWYLRRDGGWLVVLALACLGRFLLPLVLLAPGVGERPGRLALAGGLVLAASLPDFAWLILPAFPGGFGLVVQYAAAATGVLALWVWALRFADPANARPATAEPAARHA